MLVFPRADADWAIRCLAFGLCGVALCTFHSSGWRYQQMLIRALRLEFLANQNLLVSEDIRVVIILTALEAESTTHSRQEH
jgi:hypothetical protein